MAFNGFDQMTNGQFSPPFKPGQGSQPSCIMQASQDGHLLEMFGCGTACIIQPVTTLVRANGEQYTVPFDLTRTDTLTQRLTRALTDIHFANVPHEWSVAVD